MCQYVLTDGSSGKQTHGFLLPFQIICEALILKKFLLYFQFVADQYFKEIKNFALMSNCYKSSLSIFVFISPWAGNSL